MKGALIVVKAYLKTHTHVASSNQDVKYPSGSKPFIINISTGAAHIPPPMLSTFSAYVSSKLAALHIFTFLQAEHPSTLSVLNLQPGETKKGHRNMTKNNVRLPAHWCFWLAAKAETDAEFLKGRLVWANWDLDQLLARKEEIEIGDLLKIELKG